MGIEPLLFSSMTTEKQKDYEETLWRTSVAVKAELEAGAREVIRLCGAKNLSAMIAVLAKHPEKAGAALAPLFAEARAAEEAANPEKAARTRTKALTQLVKSTGATPEEIKAALEGLRAKKAEATK